MKTDDFIKTLAADSSPVLRFRPAVIVGVATGILMTAVLFFALIGFRADIAQAVESLRFQFKFVATFVLAATAIHAVAGLGRPGARTAPLIIALATAPLLVGAAVGAELFALPRQLWLPRLIGRNALPCLTLIPFLAAGPLICLFAVLRKGAPSNPGLAGAVAGLAASGIGAFFYAANCEDDSPLFVMTWYTLAILMVTATGYLAGRKLLRW